MILPQKNDFVKILKFHEIIGLGIVSLLPYCKL